MLVKPMSKSHGSLPLESTGVLKRPPHLKNLSHVRSLPKWRFGEKRPTSFLHISDAPAPGSYSLPEPSRTGRFREHNSYSFGAGSSRFGLDPDPGKHAPAPGEYGIPKHPANDICKTRATGFQLTRRGSAVRVINEDPGPGSYEVKSTLGGRGITAKGKLPSYYKPTAALPGPGAYDRAKNCCITQERSAPKVGFGTATRKDYVEAHCTRTPGPGAYVETNPFGWNAKKFAMSHRNRAPINFNAYISPGPGSYDGDGTCFGY